MGIHLAVAGLQAIETALLNGELEVLHLLVVGLQFGAQLLQFLGHLRHFAGQAVDGLGGADTGDHILTLGVDQVLAEELVLARAGVAGEGHAGGGIVATITKDHGHHVDRGAVGHLRSDIELATVVDGAAAHPTVEDRLDGDLQLFKGVGREGAAGILLDHLEEAFADLLQVGGGQFHVLLDPRLMLDPFELLVEQFVRHAEGDLTKELDETPVGVIAEAFVTRLLDLTLQCVGIEAQIEDGVHHTRHGHGRTGAHRNQQGVVCAAKTFAGLDLQGLHLGMDLLHNPRGQGPGGGGQVLQASRGGDDEARGDIEAQLGHLAQVGTLATEQFLVLAVAFLEGKNVFRDLGVHGCAYLLLKGETGMNGERGKGLAAPAT